VAAPEPLYVMRREPGTNRLVVGPRQALMARGLVGRDAVWMADTSPRFACTVKIRSTAREVPCEVETHGDRVAVRFAQPQFGVAPGQAAVFYEDDVVLGAAWIQGAEVEELGG
jgi:tRNA-specific 2-thiouridylase